MSQEQSNRDKNKNPRFGSRPPSGGDDSNQAPKKGPRFSIYWVYAIIFAVLIGVQVFNSVGSSMAESSEVEFKQMLI